MSTSRIGAFGALVVAAGISSIGLWFLIDPQSAAPGFGLPAWPDGDEAAFLAVKGDRDLAFGLVIFALLAMRRQRALAWMMLAAATAPFGDMLVVLSYDGSAATAYGVHGATAAFMVLIGCLLLRGDHAPVPQPEGRS